MISKLRGTRNNQLELSVHHRASVPQGSGCGSSRSSQFQRTYNNGVNHTDLFASNVIDKMQGSH